MNAAARKKIVAVLRLLVGLALVSYILFARGEWQTFERFAASMWLLPVLVVFGVAGTAIEAARLRLLLASQAIDLGFLQVCRLVVISFFFGVFMPGGAGGDIAKLYYLAKDFRGRTVEIATVLLVDRLVGLFSLLSVALLLALPTYELLGELPVIRALVAMTVVTLSGLLVAAALSSSASLRRNRAYVWLIARIPFSRYFQRADDAMMAFRDHRPAVLRAVLLSAVGHVLMAFTFMLAGSVLVPDAPMWATGFLAVLGMVANGLPLTPGGLGVGEAAFEALFAMIGADGGAGLMLAWRAAVLPLLVVGGLLYAAGGGSRGMSSAAFDGFADTDEEGLQA